jgi:aspartyl-tRNA(Asn)/glutamyl-tRNA(Gln) amidotransferase subunit C
MSLSLDDVRRIAHLSRIEITDEQARATLAQLNDIFGMIEQMQKVDTTGIEPMAHPIEQVQAQAQRLRDDAVTEADRRADYQQCAPATEAGLYLVPKVIE